MRDLARQRKTPLHLDSPSKARRKPRVKHGHEKPVARRPGETPAPKAAVLGLRDPAAPRTLAHASREAHGAHEDHDNDDRVNVYANKLDGVDGLGVRNARTGKIEIAKRGTAAADPAAHQMADYDDEREDAIERSKVLHPERWGEADNVVSAMNRIAEHMHDGTHSNNKPGRR
jgi:hypothetical protein